MNTLTPSNGLSPISGYVAVHTTTDGRVVVGLNGQIFPSIEAAKDEAMKYLNPWTSITWAIASIGATA